MKKLLFTAAIAVLGFTANAQEEDVFGFAEENILVEGNLGFNSTNDKNTEVKTSGFEFNPKVGYFVSDKFAVGVDLALGSEKEEDATNETKLTNFGAGVFARYYFLDLGKRFKTYGEFGVGFGTAKYDDGIDMTDDVKLNSVGAGLSLGLNYFVTKNFAINFGLTDVLSYTTSKYDVDGAESVSEFSGNLNVFNNFFNDATFGLTFLF